MTMTIDGTTYYTEEEIEEKAQEFTESFTLEIEVDGEILYAQEGWSM